MARQGPKEKRGGKYAGEARKTFRKDYIVTLSDGTKKNFSADERQKFEKRFNSDMEMYKSYHGGKTPDEYAKSMAEMLGYKDEQTRKTVVHGGLEYHNGDFDVFVKTDEHPEGARSTSSGRITSFGNVRYGIEGPKGDYKVIHLDSGAVINGIDKLKTLADVSDHIKKMAPKIKEVPGLGEKIKNFRNAPKIDMPTQPKVPKPRAKTELPFRSGQFEIAGPNYRTEGRVTTVKGKVTEYNGTMYGVQGRHGNYSVTHVPTGLLVSNSVKTKLVSLNDVAKYIKEIDVKVQADKTRIGRLADAFQRQRKEAGLV